VSTRRPTRQQQAVGDILARHEHFRSAQEWHALLRDSGETVGLATVYRTLQSLADEGAIDVLLTDGGEAVYRACSEGHHHHLVCRDCGLTIEVEAHEVERWADMTARAHGFEAVTHTLEIFGRCATCSANGVKN